MKWLQQKVLIFTNHLSSQNMIAVFYFKNKIIEIIFDNFNNCQFDLKSPILQVIKNPIQYYKNFQKQWDRSMFWANKLMEKQ